MHAGRLEQRKQDFYKPGFRFEQQGPEHAGAWIITPKGHVVGQPGLVQRACANQPPLR